MLVDHVQKCNNMLFCGKNAENPRLLLSLVESKQNIDQAAQEKLTTVCSTAHYSTTTLATTTTRGMDLCMVLQGKPLEDDYVLSHYIPLLKHPQGNNNDYNATCTIVVWQRQRGGCFMVSLSIMVIIFFALISSCCTCGLSLLVVPVLLPLLFILPLFCL